MVIDDDIFKASIKKLIMERFDIYAAINGVGASPEESVGSNTHNLTDSIPVVPSPPPSSSPVKRHPDSEDASGPNATSSPPKKRKLNADVDADALYAARLQAEENMRARPTRAGNTRRAAPVKKKTKAKTSKRVKADDDSDLGTGSETKKEVNRSGGFHVRAIHNLSVFISNYRSETTQSFSPFICAFRW